ncbi:MAG: DUF169 domain-containing protein [Chloroflexi bacterium]|nr:DUF169 domain-containing protein [Chloroflexota bacterium]
MESEESINDVAGRLRTYLGMEFRPVGVTLYAEIRPGERPSEPVTFCHMVRRAALGEEFVFVEDDLLCFNALVPLGFVQPKYVDIEPRIKTEMKSVRVGSLEGCDVVLLVLNPDQVMTISVLLDGMKASFKGETAVCGEGVAHVYTTGTPNVTFLCLGARTLGGYQAAELVMALSPDIFMSLSQKMARHGSLSQEGRAKATLLIERHLR